VEVVAWGKNARFYSIDVMRARHPAWFREDLERLFELLATRVIRPRVAARIYFDEVIEAHRRLEAGGLGASSSCARTSRRGNRSLPEPRQDLRSARARATFIDLHHTGRTPNLPLARTSNVGKRIDRLSDAKSTL
jgi:hypothetical protein